MISRDGKGHSDDAALGSRVGRLTDLSLEGRHRGQVHDRAALAVLIHRLRLRHRHRREPQHVEGADEVHLQHELEGIELEGVALPIDRPHRRTDSGPVQQGPKRSQLAREIDCRLNLRLVRDVRLCESPLHLGGRRLSLLFVHVDDHDPSAQCRQAPCTRESDPRRAARHDRRDAVEIHRPCSLLHPMPTDRNRSCEVTASHHRTTRPIRPAHTDRHGSSFEAAKNRDSATVLLPPMDHGASTTVQPRGPSRPRGSVSTQPRCRR